ncbi:hypothetical protein PSPO01_16461 [Paraphaeosphaeria sporulosa]
MHWSTVLDEAADKFDGGPRSFPAARDVHMAHHAYEPPNGDYMKLFWHQATVPGSQQDASARPHSAGWLIPDEGSICKPVFIAHSVVSAIWLLHKTLPEGTLPDDAWGRLVRAAEALALEDEEGQGSEPPPSAQKPPTASSQQAATGAQQPRKRPSPSATVSAPKRARTDTEEALSIRSQPSEPGEPDEQPEDPPRHRTVVSNNNRRHDRERRKRLALSHERKRLALGLVAPDNGATGKEKAAYASITQQDESTIAWIIKQPVSDDKDLYASTKTPYLTACTLLEKARVLGNQSSLCHAALFIQAWRERGSPFRNEGELAGSQARIGTAARRLELPCVRDDVDGDFCFAYDLCTRCDTDMAAIHIESRWAAALLGQAYSRRTAQIRDEDHISSNDRTRNRYGKGKISTQATEALMALVGLDVTEKNKRSFQRRLEIGKRWYTVTQALGWGMLTLIPHEEISNSWVERRLLQGQLAVWVELVKKERQDIYKASKTLESWLGPEGIAGGPISGKQTLSIEAEAPAAVHEIDEVRDSEDEGTEDEIEGGVDSGVDEQAHASPTPAPALRLRQLTLPELFDPIA